jgi:glucan phosphorylase
VLLVLTILIPLASATMGLLLQHSFVAQGRISVLGGVVLLLAAGREIVRTYQDQKNWTRVSILNCARVGRFSSDRSSGSLAAISGR